MDTPSVVVVPETPSRAPASGGPRGAAIVWRRDPAATLGFASVWLEPAEDGVGDAREVARREEPVVVTSGGLIALRLAELHGELASCEACNAGKCAPSGEHGSAVSLLAVSLAGEQEKNLTNAEDGPKSFEDGIGDFESGVELHGAVGSTIFFRLSGSGYGCGAAHPFFFSHGETIDLEAGVDRVFTPPKAIAEALAAEAKRAIVEAQGDCLLDPDETPSLFEVSPRIGAGGTVRASYTYLMGAPYVCGLGPDHYSVDTTLEGREPPEDLTVGRVPAWLGATLAKAPVEGLGLIPEPEREALLALFRVAPRPAATSKR